MGSNRRSYHDTGPAPARSSGRLIRWLALLGPAFFAAATQFGPGNIASAITAGSDLGYGLIWLLVLSAIFMLVYTDMNVRIGLALPSSPVQTLKEKYPGGCVLGSLTGVSVALVGFLFNVGSVIGAALGLSLLFGGSVKIWMGVVALLAVLLLLTRNVYASFEKVLLGLVGLMLAIFIATAFLTNPDWSEAATGLIPTFTTELGTFGGSVAIALLGTNFSVTAAFYASYAIRQKGTNASRYRETTLTDTLAGVISPALMTIMVVIASANVLMQQGLAMESAEDLARVLEPVIGAAAPILMGFGLFAAGFTSIVGNAVGGSFVLSDAFNWGDLRSKAARVAVAVLVLIPATIAIAFGEFPISMLITAQALTIFVVPVIATVVFLLANDRVRMGSLRNSLWQNVLAIMGWLVLIAGIILLIGDLFF